MSKLDAKLACVVHTNFAEDQVWRNSFWEELSIRFHGYWLADNTGMGDETNCSVTTNDVIMLIELTGK